MTGNAYFNSLNYSIANEDAAYELGICRQIKPKKILAICGSGARFLPLASTEPEKITALDLATQQLALADLRRSVMQHYPLQDYLRFLGYPPYSTHEFKSERAALFSELDIRPETRRYFAELFRTIDWDGLLYQGRWEQTFIGIPKKVRKLVGTAYDDIFQFTDQAEQDRFFAEKLKDRLWCSIPAAVLMLMGNATFFNTVLYRGSFVRKNIPDSYFDFYSSAFKRLFANGLTRENFFLQICFLGRLQYPEGNPLEVHAEVYAEAQKALQAGTAIELVERDVLSFAAKTQDKYDFVSLSNVPSYFSGAPESNYLQSLARCLNRGALVVVRCYLRIPQGTDTSGYVDVSHEYKDLAAKEKMQMYRILVYKYVG
jgi:S-adenosylmethionine-diacylglycerol 3-amino-3-carboxypropyl transferase